MSGAVWAFARANVRYWTEIASVAGTELERWQRRAERIDDPQLRALALSKLRDEGFNAQVAAVVATSVRERPRRVCVARALVALTVLYDFLDGVTEQLPSRAGSDQLGDGLDVSRALSEAVTLTVNPAGDYYRCWGEGEGDSGYLQELVGAVRRELALLPASATLTEVLHAGAVRCEQAQVRAHLAESLGDEQAIEWAVAQTAASGMEARDYLAGAASSVLALHAVIASCADAGFTAADGWALDRLYLLISVLPTLLDSVVDRAGEEEPGGFLRYYEDRFALASAVSKTVDQIVRQARADASGGQHLMILAGIVGYYTSHPGARSEFARPVTRAARNGLWPLSWGVLAVLHVWRGARWVRR
ncbi:MAG TPA: DUF2600 family protein [Solirubrobacteraceae bacterium]|nr:DUF2600 family protein [Solirubrobacteraceae bacterium]